ncbi:HEN1 [Scenedesmus sp. PABB004]|nr:HEN1 [Scenedesmus sp. PABB004]
MAGASSANPISELQTFYQRVGVPPTAIAYDVVSACTDAAEAPEPRFVASLSLPPVLRDGAEAQPALSFTGEGRSKAEAKRDAAAAALEHLRAQPLWRAVEARLAQAPPERVVDACTTNQGLLTDPELRAWWTYAQQHPVAGAVEAEPGAVVLPLTALAHSRHLARWLAQQRRQQGAQSGEPRAAGRAEGQGEEGEEEGDDSWAAAVAADADGEAEAEAPASRAGAALADGDMLGAMRAIRALLQAQSAAGKLLAGVSLVHGGLGLARRETLHAGGARRDSLHHLVPAALGHEVWDAAPLAVLVPADCQQPPSELRLHAPLAPPGLAAGVAGAGAPPPPGAAPGLLQQLAGLLGLGSACELVAWGRLGPRGSRALPREEWRAAEAQWAALAAAHPQPPTAGQGSAASHKHPHEHEDAGEREGGGGGSAAPGQGSAGGGGDAGMARAASFGPQQPALKRLHRDGAEGQRQQGEQQQQQQQQEEGAAGPVNSVVTVVQGGGGAAAMDWEAGAEAEARGAPGGAATSAPRSVLPPDVAGGSAGGAHVDVPPPFIYSRFYETAAAQEAAGLNLRASWLAGRAIYGPALLAGCGVARGLSTLHVVRWRTYSAACLSVGLAAAFPARAYTSRALGTPGAWSGDAPVQLLQRYVARHAAWVGALAPFVPSLDAAAATASGAAADAAAVGTAAGGSAGTAAGAAPAGLEWQLAVADAAEPAASAFNCSARLRVQPMAAAAAIAARRGLGAAAAGLRAACETAAGPGAARAWVEQVDSPGWQPQLVVTADSGPASSPAEAQNCAALAAIHLLQRLDAAALAGAGAEAGEGDAAAAGAGDGALLGEPEALWPGDAADGQAPAAGLVAKVDAQLYVPPASADGGSARPWAPGAHSLESLRGHRLLLGAGAAVPQLEALLAGLTPGGAAQARVALPLAGTDPLGTFAPQPAVLAVHLLELRAPRAAVAGTPGGQGHQALFDPPLGVARRQLVAELARELGAETIVDVGCGEGALLRHLLRGGASFTRLRRLVGLDASPSALAAAARKLQAAGSEWLTVGAAPAGADEQLAAAADARPAAAPASRGGSGTPSGSAGALAAAALEGEGSTLTAPWLAGTAAVAAAAAAPGSAEALGGDIQASSLLRQLSINSGAPPQRRPAALPPRAPTRAAAPSGAEVQQRAAQPQGGSVVREPGHAWACTLELLQGDAAAAALAAPGPWAARGLAPPGCDLAACLEVLEHLDPADVPRLGDAVLGGLRPRAAVFTTPNWEYNAVLQLCAPPGGGPAPAWPGPPGRDGAPLRHAGHRFEWTRAEFAAWAEELAARHGCSVQVLGLGRAIREEEALAAMPCGAGGAGGREADDGAAPPGDALRPESGVGAATQVAVFRRRADAEQPGGSGGAAMGEAGGGEGGAGGGPLRLVWGPTRAVMRVGRIDAGSGGASGGAMEAEAVVERF